MNDNKTDAQRLQSYMVARQNLDSIGMQNANGRSLQEIVNMDAAYKQAADKSVNAYLDYWRALSPQSNLAQNYQATNSQGMRFSSKISWGKQSVSVHSEISLRDARKRTLMFAIKNGYTYPKWCQFWRWNETRPDLDFSARSSRR